MQQKGSRDRIEVDIEFKYQKQAFEFEVMELRVCI